tara:strand:+ start:825 stop:1520 length:696 start_codon:yes stop_codon:yes gene_type:complete
MFAGDIKSPHDLKCISCGFIIKNFQKYKFHGEKSFFKKVLRDDRVYKCHSCELVQVNHREINNDCLKEYYSNYYRKNSKSLSYENRHYWKFYVRGMAIADIAANHFQDKNYPYEIYELGSGFGLNLLKLKDIFPNANIYTDDLDKGSLNKNIQVSEIDGGKYNIIVLSHVLEHLDDPIQWIVRIKNALKSQGLLIIEVPNDNEAFSKVTDIYHEPHISFFNSNSLSILFQR